MRTYAPLRRRADFARVQRRGKRRVGAAFVLLSAEGSGISRVGITTAKTVGNAVVRNRIRRRVKGFLDRTGFGGPPFRDIVVIARPGAGDLAGDDLAAELAGLFG
jgi:ribonuclease P protein component